MDHFLSFYPPNSLKFANFKKMKEKRWEILSFYTSVQKSWSYAILFVRYGAWCMYLLVFILGYFFLPFYPPPPQPFKNWKFQKNGKKFLEIWDIIILHKCTKNQGYMLYCSWDIVRDRCNCYFSFWAISCSFTP